MSMWKQLFSQAPAGAYENLLSPKRKAIYAFFALAPGTSLGLYLYSVQLDMDKENERLRMEKVGEEMETEKQLVEKDRALENAIAELRSRLTALEEERMERTIESRSTPEFSSNSPDRNSKNSSISPSKDEHLSFFESQKQKLLSSFSSSEDTTQRNEDATSKQAPPSGINERVRERERDLIRRDVQAQKEADKQKS